MGTEGQGLESGSGLGTDIRCKGTMIYFSLALPILPQFTRLAHVLLIQISSCRNVSEPVRGIRQTNNVAEIQAAERAVSQAKKIGKTCETCSIATRCIPSSISLLYTILKALISLPRHKQAEH